MIPLLIFPVVSLNPFPVIILGTDNFAAGLGHGINGRAILTYLDQKHEGAQSWQGIIVGVRPFIQQRIRALRYAGFTQTPGHPGDIPAQQQILDDKTQGFIEVLPEILVKTWIQFSLE